MTVQPSHSACSQSVRQESRKGSASGFSAAHGISWGHPLSRIQLVAELDWNFLESFIPFYDTSTLFSMWPLFHMASLGFLPARCSQGYKASYSLIRKEAFQRGSQQLPVSEGTASEVRLHHFHCIPLVKRSPMATTDSKGEGEAPAPEGREAKNQQPVLIHCTVAQQSCPLLCPDFS